MQLEVALWILLCQLTADIQLISISRVQCNHAQRCVLRIELTDRVGDGVWNPTLEGSGNTVALSSGDSGPTLDDI